MNHSMMLSSLGPNQKLVDIVLPEIYFTQSPFVNPDRGDEYRTFSCFRTRLEAEAYCEWMRGVHFFHKEDWKQAVECLSHAKTIYERISATVDEDTRALYRQRVEETNPQIRFCAYNIGDESAVEDLIKVRLRARQTNSTAMFLQVAHVFDLITWSCAPFEEILFCLSQVTHASIVFGLECAPLENTILWRLFAEVSVQEFRKVSCLNFSLCSADATSARHCDGSRRPVQAGRPDCQNRGRQSGSEVSWLGKTIPIKNQKVRVLLISSDEVMKQLDSVTTADAKLEVLENTLNMLREAGQLVQEEVKTTAKDQQVRNG